MAASALITFDTTAPTVTLQQPFVSGSDILIPFTTDEQADVVVLAAETMEGVPVTAVVEPAEARLRVTPPADETRFRLTLNATDDVLNESEDEYTMSLGIPDFTYPLMLSIDDIPTELVIDAADTELVFDSNDSELTIDTVDSELTIDPNLETELTIEVNLETELTLDPSNETELSMDDVPSELTIEDYEPEE